MSKIEKRAIPYLYGSLFLKGDVSNWPNRVEITIIGRYAFQTTKHKLSQQ